MAKNETCCWSMWMIYTGRNRKNSILNNCVRETPWLDLYLLRIGSDSTLFPLFYQIIVLLLSAQLSCCHVVKVRIDLIYDVINGVHK
jgi:hypothetical protein